MLNQVDNSLVYHHFSLEKHLEKKFVVENIEEDSLVKDRTSIFSGDVPHVIVHVQPGINNKKVTTVSSFELFRIDASELQSYLSNKCAASATVQTVIGSVKTGSKESLVVQIAGN